MRGETEALSTGPRVPSSLPTPVHCRLKKTQDKCSQSEKLSFFRGWSKTWCICSFSKNDTLTSWRIWQFHGRFQNSLNISQHSSFFSRLVDHLRMSSYITWYSWYNPEFVHSRWWWSFYQFILSTDKLAKSNLLFIHISKPLSISSETQQR